VVLVIDRAAVAEVTAAELEAALDAAMAQTTLSEAVAQVTRDLGMKRREVYRAALARKERNG
jgi:DNA-binding phage protein